MLLCFVPRPWQQRRSRRTQWYARYLGRYLGMPGCQAARLLAHQLAAHQPTGGGHRSASTCPPYVGPQVAHAAGRGLFVVSQWVDPYGGLFVFVLCRIVSRRVGSRPVLSGPNAVVLAVLCVLGQVLAGSDHLHLGILVLDLDFVSHSGCRTSGRVDDNYKFSSPHPGPGLARQPDALGSPHASPAHPHSLQLHCSANHVHVHAPVSIPDPVHVHVKVHAPCPCSLPVDLHVDLC